MNKSIKAVWLGRIKSRLPVMLKERMLVSIRLSRKLKAHFIRIPNDRGTYHSVDPELVRDYNKHRPLGPKKLVCYLPYNSISFCSGGRALACTYNQAVEFGHYPERSIRELWFGESGKRLREFMEHNDLSMGCQHCEYFLKHRVFTGIKATVFDKHASYEKDQYPRVMEFDIANTCNLECIMCNGNASSAIRKNRERLPPVPNPYDAEFVRQLEAFIPHLREAKFYGGEPFLIDIYYDIWNKIVEKNPDAEMFVLTNGTILNDRVKEILNKGRFALGVSIDAATRETYERIRMGASYEKVMKNLEYFAAYGRNRGKGIVISTTPMRMNWQEVPKMLALCNAVGATTYLSYLKRPTDLALWNLPPVDLQEIYETLSEVDLPEQTASQRFNKQCYRDFLGQIQSWKERNERGEGMESWE